MDQEKPLELPPILLQLLSGVLKELASLPLGKSQPVFVEKFGERSCWLSVVAVQGTKSQGGVPLRTFLVEVEEII